MKHSLTLRKSLEIPPLQRLWLKRVGLVISTLFRDIKHLFNLHSARSQMDVNIVYICTCSYFTLVCKSYELNDAICELKIRNPRKNVVLKVQHRSW